MRNVTCQFAPRVTAGEGLPLDLIRGQEREGIWEENYRVASRFSLDPTLHPLHSSRDFHDMGFTAEARIQAAEHAATRRKAT